MRLIIIAFLVFPLSGCFFFYVPGSVIDSIGDSISGDVGNLCVPSTSYVGQRITAPNGKVGTVTKLEGTSRRCTQESLPIRAVVEFGST